MALTTPKMGLRVWDQLSDSYDHNQLADNWAKVDQHDHSPGRGVLIPTEGIADQAITQAKISNAVQFIPPDNSITTAKLLDGAVTPQKRAIVPAVRVTKSVAQSIAANSTVAVTWNAEDFDTDTNHDNVTNNSRLTCSTAGLYRVFGFIRFDVMASTWEIILRKNGTTDILRIPPSAYGSGNPNPALSFGTDLSLVAADYVEVYVVNGDTTTARNVLGATTAPSSSFGMTYQGRLS